MTKSTMVLTLILSTTLICASDSFADLNDGLVVYYPFSGNANDASGSGNDGVVNGATLTTDRFEGIDTAYSFDGVDDCIECDSFADIEQTITISSWIKCTSLMPNMHVWVIAAKADNAVHSGFTLHLKETLDGIPMARFGICDNDGGRHEVHTGWPGHMDIDTWYFVAASYDGTTQNIYLNDTLLMSNAYSGEISPATSNLLIGRTDDQHSGMYFKGSIDDVRIYNRALSDSEILGLYSGSPMTTIPVADAGPDQTIEQESHAGASVTLDGSGSSGPDDDPLTYSWTWDGGSAIGVSPTVVLPLGTTTITLVVNDGTTDSNPDTVDITVEDTTDSDGDGVPDNQDTDDDNDGVADGDDAFPTDPDEQADNDNDGTGDNADPDDDNDGVADGDDAFPTDAAESSDSDGDGVGDNADAFPTDATETADSDGDGVGDNGDAFPNDPTETLDSDGDGVGDNADAFPNDPDETSDSDGDGVGDEADAFPSSDVTPTVTVAGCDTGVANVLNWDDTGASINDDLAVIDEGAYRNHGAYVRTVTHFAETLLDDGVITEEAKDLIVSCAARSDIGKKN